MQVGPFSNPSETYQYYNLPFCTPKEGKEYKTEGLGEVLEGDRLVNTPFSIRFRVDKENEILCSRELTESDLKKFRQAVKKDYYFQVRPAAAPNLCHSHSACRATVHGCSSAMSALQSASMFTAHALLHACYIAFRAVITELKNSFQC